MSDTLSLTHPGHVNPCRWRQQRAGGTQPDRLVHHLEAAWPDHRWLCAFLFSAGRQRPFHPFRHRSPGPGQVVCPGACAALPGARLFHRRRRCRVRFPGRGDEIPGGRGQQGALLWRGQRVRLHPGGLLLHHPASVCRDLEAGRGIGAGHRISILGAGHQRTGHYPDRPHTGAGDWNCPRCGGDCLQHRHRPVHAPDVPQGRGSQGRRSHSHAGTGGRTAAVADYPFVCCHGGAAGVGHLGKTGPGRRFLGGRLWGQMDAGRWLRRRSGRHDGSLDGG